MFTYIGKKLQLLTNYRLSTLKANDGSITKTLTNNNLPSNFDERIFSAIIDFVH